MEWNWVGLCRAYYPLHLHCRLWLVFSKFKLVRWGWLSGIVAVLAGAFILAVFLALLNYLTPSGKVTVAGRVVEVIPNVTGQIVAIPVKTNVPVKTGDVLFQIDPAPFNTGRAAKGVPGRSAPTGRDSKSNYEQAAANVVGLTAQLKYNTQRLTDIKKLSTEGATPSSRSRTPRCNTRPWPRNSM